MKYLFLALFLGDAALHLLACCPPEKHRLRCVTKAFLMPLLALWYVSSTPAYSSLILAGLVFGFLGDVFLILPHKTKLFALGLFAFAIGHACYILYFGRMIDWSKAPAPATLAAACLVYLLGGVLLFRILLPRMPKVLFVPCAFYMLIISLMSLSVLLAWLTGGGGPLAVAFFGSLLFIVSDSLLSISTFRTRLPHRYLAVMSTYIVAQSTIAATAAYLGGF